MVALMLISIGAFVAFGVNATPDARRVLACLRETIAIARVCIRGGARGRFFNVVDLVNRLEAETRAGRQGRRPGSPVLQPHPRLLQHPACRGRGRLPQLSINGSTKRSDAGYASSKASLPAWIKIAPRFTPHFGRAKLNLLRRRFLIAA